MATVADTIGELASGPVIRLMKARSIFRVSMGKSWRRLSIE